MANTFILLRLLALENDHSARVELLFKNVFKNSALSSSHATPHEQQDWTPLTVGHGHHHFCTLRVTIYCFHLFHQSREHSCHLQILGYSLKPLFPGNTAPYWLQRTSSIFKFKYTYTSIVPEIKCY